MPAPAAEVERPGPLRAMRRLLAAAGSLQLAVALIVVYIAVLIWTTTVLSQWYGAAELQYGVYGAWWFIGLNVLLGINVLSAALVRFPWRRRQTGFVVTHLGILVLLAGCVVSFRHSVETHLFVYEGHSSNRAFQESSHFEIRVIPNDLPPEQQRRVEPIVIPFRSGPFNWGDYGKQLSWFPWGLTAQDRGVLYDEDGVKLEVLDYCSDSRRKAAPRIALRAEPLRRGPRDEAATLTLSVSPTPHGHPGGPMAGEQRQTTPQGNRVMFWMAQSADETAAFLQSRPEGELGRLGQVVLFARGKAFRFTVEDLEREPRRKLGETGLEVELLGVNAPRAGVSVPGVQLAVHAGDDPPQRMHLHAAFPQWNIVDRRHGVFGTFWPGRGDPPSKDPDDLNAEAFHDARQPRIDILQGHDLRLYWRTWQPAKGVDIGPWPSEDDGPVGAQLVVFADSDDAEVLRLDAFVPRDKPDWDISPEPFRRENKRREPRARVRLTVAGLSEEFWLAGRSWRTLPDQQKLYESGGKQIVVAMPQDYVTLGFAVHLHDFVRKLEPGTAMPSYYGSQIDLRAAPPRDEPERQGEVLVDKVQIEMNEPLDFTDPQSGRSYRLFQSSFEGPWKPGSPEYEELVGRAGGRDLLYGSLFSVNTDLGRGLKYAGSLLIILGMWIVYYMRTYFFQKPKTPAGREA